MNPRAARLLAVAIGGWLLLANATGHARTLKYPDLKDVAPLLRFELPEGWKAHQAANKVDALYCESDQGIGLVITFMVVPP